MRHADPTPMPAVRHARTMAATALLVAALAGCGEAPPPASPPADAAPAEAPAPAGGEHTALRDAMQAPVDRAEDARAATEAAEAERARALEDAGG
jgi:predicted small lipoprotein YifL